MRKTLLLFCLMLSLAVFADDKKREQDCPPPPPQEQLTPEQQARKHTAMLTRMLKLSEQQVDTVYKIHLKYAKLRNEVEKKKDKHKLFDLMSEELRGVLSEEQYQVFEEFKKKGTNGRQLQLGRQHIMPPKPE